MVIRASLSRVAELPNVPLAPYVPTDVKVVLSAENWMSTLLVEVSWARESTRLALAGIVWPRSSVICAPAVLGIFAEFVVVVPVLAAVSAPRAELGELIVPLLLFTVAALPDTLLTD